MKDQHTFKYILPAILLLAPGVNRAQDAAAMASDPGKTGDAFLSLIYDNLFLILGMLVVGVAIWVLYRTNETLTKLYTYNLLQQQGISPVAPEAAQTIAGIRLVTADEAIDQPRPAGKGERHPF